MQSWPHVLVWRASARPDLLALTDQNGATFTYAQLHAAAEREAGGWALRGVRPGDPVAVVAHNSAQFLVSVLALMRAGAVPVLVNWRLAAPEVGQIFDISRPVAALCDPQLTSVVDAYPDAAGWPRICTGSHPGWTEVGELAGDPPEWPAEQLRTGRVYALLHTSGTTGGVKVVPLTNGALQRSLAGFALEIGDQVAGSRHLQLMPMFHLAGFAQAMQCFMTAGTLIVHDEFDPVAVIDSLERDHVQFFTAAPTIIHRLVEEVRSRPGPVDLTALREIQYGSAPIDTPLLQRAIESLGCRFRQIYGSTECQSFVSLLAPEDHIPGSPQLASAGKLTLGWEARAVDRDGHDVPTGETGELLVRGDALFDGYLNDPAATDAALLPGGWYRTGDLVQLDGDGYLHVVGRAKDMIISGGENIYPAQVEEVLAGHPQVSQVAVIGLPDERWGERVHAVVVPNSGTAPVTEAEIITWCRERMAHFKCPRSVSFATVLPRNATGKVVKQALREAVLAER